MTLKAYWKLDGNAFDSSGNGLNGVINGVPVWVTGNKGTDTALKFNGVDTYVDFGTTLSLTSQFSILMWAQIGPKAGWRALISKGESMLDKDHNYGIWFDTPNNLILAYGNGTDYKNAQATSSLDSNWHRIACIYNSSTDMRIYVDSVLQSVILSGGAVSPAANTKKTILGAIGTTAEFFEGAIQEVKIYDNALTAAEVLADYNVVTTPLDIPQNSTRNIVFNATGQAPFTYSLKIDGALISQLGPVPDVTVTFPTLFNSALGLHTIRGEMVDTCSNPQPQQISVEKTINITPGCPDAVSNINLTLVS